MPRKPEAAPGRGLTVAQALDALAKIDRAVLAFCVTAPNAVLAMGGGTVPKARLWMQSRCQMTCVGPVPRLPEEAWEACAMEHADRQREGQRQQLLQRITGPWKGGVEGLDGPAPGDLSPSSPASGPRLRRAAGERHP